MRIKEILGRRQFIRAWCGRLVRPLDEVMGSGRLAPPRLGLNGNHLMTSHDRDRETTPFPHHMTKSRHKKHVQSRCFSIAGAWQVIAHRFSLAERYVLFSLNPTCTFSISKCLAKQQPPKIQPRGGGSCSKRQIRQQPLYHVRRNPTTPAITLFRSVHFNRPIPLVSKLSPKTPQQEKLTHISSSQTHTPPKTQSSPTTTQTRHKPPDYS